MTTQTTQTTQTANDDEEKANPGTTRRATAKTRDFSKTRREEKAWDCEKYEEIRPEDEAKVFEEIATANEGDFLFEGERCCS